MAELFYTQSTLHLFVPDVELSRVNYSAESTRPRIQIHGCNRCNPASTSHYRISLKYDQPYHRECEPTPIIPLWCEAFLTSFPQTKRNGLFSVILYGKINGRHRWTKGNLSPSLKLVLKDTNSNNEQSRFASFHFIEFKKCTNSKRKKVENMLQSKKKKSHQWKVEKQVHRNQRAAYCWQVFLPEILKYDVRNFSGDSLTFTIPLLFRCNDHQCSVT